MKAGLAMWAVACAAAAPTPSSASASKSASASASASSASSQVREMFLWGWRAYQAHAWGHDELLPLSNASLDWAASAPLGVTLVDSLDTLWLMGLFEDFERAVAWVATDFRPRRHVGRVHVFEATIRCLGGLLSAHALSGGDARLLAAAIELGEVLLPALAASPSGVPFAEMASLRDGVVHVQRTPCGTAGAGSLVLEFRHLANAARRPDFARAADRAMAALAEAPGRLRGGLVPSALALLSSSSSSSGCAAAFVDAESSRAGVGAGVDSYYEYLLKGWIQGKDGEMKDQWLDAARAVHSNLVQKRGPTTFLADLVGNATLADDETTHLACFWPGVLALSVAADAAPMEDPGTTLALADALVRGCVDQYATASGLAPEATRWDDDGAHHHPSGTNSHSPLRPETVESLFVLYRVTRDAKYVDWARRIFRGLGHARVAHGGLASIADVRSATPAHRDRMHSFVLAETLKYLYLIFRDAEDGENNRPPENELLPLDAWVFNTEAHPLPIFSSSKRIAAAEPKEKSSTATWVPPVDVVGVGRVRFDETDEDVADAVERFAQAAHRAGHRLSTEDVATIFATARRLHPDRRTRTLSPPLRLELLDGGATFDVPVYEGAFEAASRVARTVARRGLPAFTPPRFKKLLRQICAQRRCFREGDDDNDDGDADASSSRRGRLSLEVKPAGTLSIDPWEDVFETTAAAARELFSRRRIRLDAVAFDAVVDWFCDRRACPARLRTPHLELTLVRAEDSGDRNNASLTVDCAPWEDPLLRAREAAAALYADADPAERAHVASAAADWFCARRDCSSSTALPRAPPPPPPPREGGSFFELVEEASSFFSNVATCGASEEPAACVERAAAAVFRRAKPAVSALNDAAAAAMRALCAERLCTRPLNPRVWVTFEGRSARIEPWIDPWDTAGRLVGGDGDDGDESGPLVSNEERRRVIHAEICRLYRSWCDAPPPEDSNPTSSPLVWLVHFHKAAGTSFCGLAKANELPFAAHERATHGHLELGAERLAMDRPEDVVEGLADLRRRGVRFGSSEHAFPDGDALRLIQGAFLERRTAFVFFVTIVREPVSRSISSYEFHGGRGGRCAGGACADAVAFGEAEANLMTRVFNGLPFGPVQLRQSPAKLRADATLVLGDANRTAAAALASLASLDLVLVFDRLADPETAALIRRRLHWRHTALPHLIPKRPSFDAATDNNNDDMLLTPVDSAQRARIAALNELDRRIYDAALAQFDADRRLLP